MDDISVPVLVDDVKQHPNFGYARCEYFTIECDTPSPGWVLGLAGRQIPFLMTGLSGIILRPSLEEAFFTTPSQIEGLFEVIEADERVRVGTADIWMPNRLVASCLPEEQPLARGCTFRIGHSLFHAALAFRTDTMDRGQFEELAHEMADAVTFSMEEDKAFRVWRRNQVDLAREQYPKNDNLTLHWEDHSQDVGL